MMTDTGLLALSASEPPSVSEQTSTEGVRLVIVERGVEVATRSLPDRRS